MRLESEKRLVGGRDLKFFGRRPQKRDQFSHLFVPGKGLEQVIPSKEGSALFLHISLMGGRRE